MSNFRETKVHQLPQLGFTLLNLLYSNYLEWIRHIEQRQVTLVVAGQTQST